MGKGIKEPEGVQELEPISLSELIHQHVRVAIETAVHEEWRATLIRDDFHGQCRRSPRRLRGLRADVG